MSNFRIRQMPRKSTGHPNLLSVIYFFGIHVMMGETVKSHLLPFCPFLSVITVRINRNPGSLTPEHLEITHKASNGLIFLSNFQFTIPRYS